MAGKFKRGDRDKKLFDQFPSVTRKQWEEKAKKDLRGKDPAILRWRPFNGVELEPVYFREDLESVPHLPATVPGSIPYIRGKKSESNNWHICEIIDAVSPEDANVNALRAIGNGVDSLIFRCRTTRNGINGIPVHRYGYIAKLLSGIPLDRVFVSFEPGIAGREIYSLFLSYIYNSGISSRSVSGLLFHDPIREWSLSGEVPVKTEYVYKDISGLIEYCDEHTPSYRCLCIDSSEFYESGADTIQELAFTLAKGVEYLSGLTDSGISVDKVSRNLFFSFPVSSSYFTEVAKFRAARLLWAKIVNEYNPEDAGSGEMLIHARTGLWNKTVYDPYVNMIRTTVESIIAAVSGCNFISTGPMDETYESSTEFTRRMARNTQHIIKEESYMDRVIDPAAGSYYVENLTREIAEKAFEKFLETENKGGYTECLKSGFIQKDISDVSEQKKIDVEKRKLVLLGTNQYPNNEEKMSDSLGNSNDLSEFVFSDGEYSDIGGNGVESLINAFQENDITLGDVIKTKDTIEKSVPVTKIEPYRGAEIFERIRLQTEAYAGNDENKRPQVFLLKFGDLAARNARAAFSANFFGCAGYGIIEDTGYDSVDDGIQSAIESGAQIIVLCGSDGDYSKVGEASVKSLKNASRDISVVLAGKPDNEMERLEKAGVDQFIHLGSNVAETLMEYQKRLGVISS